MSGFFGAGGEQKHVKSHFADGDHPTVLCGGDRAPTPVEWLLHALATCLTAGIGNIAAARGIKLHKVRSFVEGDIDLRGILGISDEVRNGYRNISIRFEIEGDAPPEKLQQILDQARDRSAVFDVLTKGVPVAVEMRSGRSRYPVLPSKARRGRPSPFTRYGAFHVRDRRRRHRSRPGRTCHEPLPFHPRHRPRCVRARRDWCSLAVSRLGLAQASHAELAKRTSRLALLRRLPGRVHAAQRVPGASAELRRYLLRAGRWRRPKYSRSCLSAMPFIISTSRGSWRARAVVVATGQCDIPFVPSIARSLSRRVLSLHSSQYRSPSGLPQGGALVVGASASGVQIADELQRSGRKVTLAVGQHTRAPRTWRGHDIFWWMDRAGILAERTRDLPDADAAKRQPALQLAGRPDRSNVDLRTLQDLGVRLAGRVVKAEGDRIGFSDDLPSVVTSAQAKLERLLVRIDAFAGFGRDSPHDEVAPVDLSHEAPLSLSTEAENIRTVVWATGYRRAFPWLRVPGAVGPDGEIAHVDGVSRCPGSLRTRVPSAAQARFAFYRRRRLGRARSRAADLRASPPIRRSCRLDLAPGAATHASRQ